MRVLRMLGLALFATFTASAFLGSCPASAAVLCKAKEETCLGLNWRQPPVEIAGENSGAISLESAIGEKCSGSLLKGKATTSEEQGAGPLFGEISSLTFTGCSPCSAVQAANLPYKTSLVAGEAVGNGTQTVESSGKGAPQLALTSCPFGLACTYGTAKISLEVSGGSPATTSTNKSVLTLEAGNEFFCGSSTKLNGIYKITSPNPAFVSKKLKPATLCEAEAEEVGGELVCPKGEEASGEIGGGLEKGATATFESTEGPTGTITCSSSTLTSDFTESGQSPKGGGITGLTFEEGKPCTSTLKEISSVEVTVENLPFDATMVAYEQAVPPQAKLLIGKMGGFIRVLVSYMKNGQNLGCTYGPEKEELVGKWVNGKPSKFVFTAQPFVRLGGNAGDCPAKLKFTGSYEVDLTALSKDVQVAK